MNKISSVLIGVFAIVAFSFAGVSAQSSAKLRAGSIDQQVYHSIHMLPRYGVFDYITFQVNGPVVTLMGKVNSLGTKSEAAASVKTIPGVERVVNNIVELPPSAMDDAIRRQTLRTLAAGGLGGYFWEANPDVRIIVQNGHVTLEGQVMNSGDVNRAKLLANQVPNVFSVQNDLTVGDK